MAALALLVLALAGCGGHKPRPAALRVERADLVLVARALHQLERPVQSEVAAARSVWPELTGGLPASVAPATRAQIALAERRAAAVALPRPLEVEGDLTGPAAQLGGLVKAYARLSQRGWGFLAAAAAAAAGGGRGARGAGSADRSGSVGGAESVGSAGRSGLPGESAAADFLRANSGLYVYCVYDGHFDLSLLGKKLPDVYRKLGGPDAFGEALTDGEVEALARAYSIGATRLLPHPSARVHV